jgi:hypothetical protein
MRGGGGATRGVTTTSWQTRGKRERGAREKRQQHLKAYSALREQEVEVTWQEDERMRGEAEAKAEAEQQ